MTALSEPLVIRAADRLGRLLARPSPAPSSRRLPLFAAAARSRAVAAVLFSPGSASSCGLLIVFAGAVFLTNVSELQM